MRNFITVLMVIFGMLITVPVTAQVQKYVIDGKTYYGDPPPASQYEKITESRPIQLSNIYVVPEDIQAADSRLYDARLIWDRDISDIDNRALASKRAREKVDAEERKRDIQLEIQKGYKKESRHTVYHR